MLPRCLDCERKMLSPFVLLLQEVEGRQILNGHLYDPESMDAKQGRGEMWIIQQAVLSGSCRCLANPKWFRPWDNSLRNCTQLHTQVTIQPNLRYILVLNQSETAAILNDSNPIEITNQSQVVARMRAERRDVNHFWNPIREGGIDFEEDIH